MLLNDFFFLNPCSELLLRAFLILVLLSSVCININMSHPFEYFYYIYIFHFLDGNAV